MKLSEKYLSQKAKMRRETEHSVGAQTLHLEQIKIYGEICRLEGKKNEASKSLKGSEKAFRVIEIKNQLKELAKQHNIQ